MFFPKLDHLLLKDLHKLTRFCFGNLVEFSCLRDLQIIKCPLIQTFISSSTLGNMTASSEKVENTCAPPLFDSKVAFPSVEKILIESMESLNKIWADLLDAESFCHLNHLRVNSCGKLLNIFPSTMLGRIQKLDKLEIWNCYSLEEIFESQGHGAIQSQSQITTQSTLVETPFQLVLPKLTHLHLYRLPKLKGFYRRMHVTEWPSLKKLEVYGCDQVQIFSSEFSSFRRTNGDDQLGIEIKCPLFSINKVAFPNLEELQLSWININTIWHASIASSYVEKLRKLIIQACDNLEYLFSSSMARDMVMLGHLEIRSCRKMREVLSTEKVEENGNLIFHQLRFLRIENLPQLRRFCYGNYIRFPCLSELLISQCPELKTFASSSSFECITANSNMEENTCTALFDTKVTFPKLERLTIEFMSSLDKIWDNQLDADSFHQLNHLRVGNCKKLLNIFPFSLSEKLQSLDKLDIRFCISVEEIFGSQELGAGQSQAQNITHANLGELVTEFFFPTLTDLCLYGLPKLKAFYHQMHTTKWPSLKKLKVHGCDQVQIFASELSSFPRIHGDDQLEIQTKCPLFWISKVAFPCLEELELERNKIMKEIWHGPCLCDYFPKLKVLKLSQLFLEQSVVQPSTCLVPYFISFKNLTSLEVFGCHELINLVGYSMAKSMVQLTRMRISKCEMLKEIVACMDDEVKDGIVFDKLKYLELIGLPRLASFCPGNCNFDFPFLEEVTVMSCPNMQIFSQGECKTYNKLQKVKSAIYEDEGLWEGNLNSTIQKMFMEKVGYFWLENLKLSEFPELIEIWSEKPQEILPFKRLMSLEVCNCNSLRYLLTTSMALGLAQLEDLKVTNCAAMEQVITGEGAEKMFPELYSITLESCPNLKYFYEGSSRLEFPCLSEITVVDCPVLAAFAPSFSSKQEKEITTKERESEERPSVIPTQPFFSDKATFPELCELKLEGNNIMKEVWRGHHPGDYFPELAIIELINFTEQSAVLPPHFFQSLPNLQKLLVSNASFDEIFQCHPEVGAEEGPANALPLLTMLKLCKLHELKFLWKEELHLELVFDNLKILEVQECNKLKNLVPSFISFKNLMTLEVSKCQGLIHVVGYSTAKSMVQLEKLSISECDLIGEIVALGNEEMKDDICFSNLEYLELRDLPRLESFCFGNGGFDFPTLQNVIVMGCPNMQIFSRGQLSTPKLQEVKLKEDGDECCWYGDLNSTIQHLFMEKSS